MIKFFNESKKNIGKYDLWVEQFYIHGADRILLMINRERGRHFKIYSHIQLDRVASLCFFNHTTQQTS